MLDGVGRQEGCCHATLRVARTWWSERLGSREKLDPSLDRGRPMTDWLSEDIRRSQGPRLPPGGPYACVWGFLTRASFASLGCRLG